MCSTPPPITTSWTPRGDLRGREVHGLLRRAALKVDRRRRGLDREALLQPGVAADVQALRAELRDAAGDHVLDLPGLDSARSITAR